MFDKNNSYILSDNTIFPSKSSQMPPETTEDADAINMSDDLLLEVPEGTGEDDFLKANENFMDDTKNNGSNDDFKPEKLHRVENPQTVPTNKEDLLKTITEQQKEIRNLTTAIDDLNLQIKDLLVKEKNRQEEIEKFLGKITEGCTQLNQTTERFNALNEKILDDSSKELDVYFNSNFERLENLSKLSDKKIESVIRQVIEIGVKNLNNCLSEQRKFVKKMSLKFSLSSWALIFSGFLTPLFILYLIAILKGWIPK